MINNCEYRLIYDSRVSIKISSNNKAFYIHLFAIKKE